MCDIKRGDVSYIILQNENANSIFSYSIFFAEVCNQGELIFKRPFSNYILVCPIRRL